MWIVGVIIVLFFVSGILGRNGAGILLLIGGVLGFFMFGGIQGAIGGALLLTAVVCTLQGRS